MDGDSVDFHDEFSYPDYYYNHRNSLDFYGTVQPVTTNLNQFIDDVAVIQSPLPPIKRAIRIEHKLQLDENVKRIYQSYISNVGLFNINQCFEKDKKNRKI